MPGDQLLYYDNSSTRVQRAATRSFARQSPAAHSPMAPTYVPGTSTASGVQHAIPGHMQDQYVLQYVEFTL